MLEKFLVVLNKFCKQVNTLVSIMVALIMAIIFFIVTSEVISRTFFGYSFMWILEISSWGLVWIAFLASSLLIYENGHISVTMVHKYLPPKTVEILKVVFDLIAIYFFVYLYARAGYWFADRSRNILSTSKILYEIYPRSIVFIGFTLMALQTLNNFLNRLLKLQILTPEEWYEIKKSKNQHIK